MHRIDHTTKDVDLFGSGKHGFTEGNPGTEAATVVTDDWLNGVQEEICNVIEDVGITLVKGTRDQLLTALMMRFSGWAHTLQLCSPSAYYRYGLATDGDLVVTCGNNGTDLTTQYTYDGLVWTNQDAGTAISKVGLDIAYGNGYWVMVVSGGANIYYNADPTGSWSFNDITITQLNAVTYGNGYWCAVGPSGALYYATDPTGSWTSNTQGSEHLNDVIYDATDDLWVIVGENGTVYTRATNPTGSFTLNDQGSQDFNAITKSDSLYVTVADANIIMSATDPAGTWTSRTSAAKSTCDLLDIDWGSGVFMIAATHGSAIEGDGAQISYDGITWEIVPAELYLNGCLYAHNRFYLLGSGTDIAMSNRHGG